MAGDCALTQRVVFALEERIYGFPSSCRCNSMREQRGALGTLAWRADANEKEEPDCR